MESVRRSTARVTGRARRLADAARRSRRVEAPDLPTFIPTDEPVVSVVIPVYNHWPETHRCLAALAKTVGPSPFEVIVVDDCSTDRGALESLRSVPGIRVVAQARNGGFVRACNAGIALARGEFVVLLNNDTEVNPFWLIPLVETMNDPTVGLVGSRLVYPDGRLQEAGGVVFSDASAWNYGRFQNPECHSYTYKRDVDYCSGASVMVRRSVLEQLGGLDTRYAPAYYEDTDLAFGVRSLGLRTVYEPRSLVVHHEGVSNGTDTSGTGLKRYQEINRAVFAEKWAAELSTQPLSPEQDPDFEIEVAIRHRMGPIVLIVDQQVPTPDLDSGSLRMSRIIRGVKDLGYAPIVVPSDERRIDPWTGDLLDAGIEVCYRTPGPHGNEDISIEQLTALLGDRIVSVLLSRVGPAGKYLYPISHALPHAQIIFDTVDLHQLREARMAQLEDDADLIRLAARTKALEDGLMQAADTTLVVSTVEHSLLSREHPDLDIRVLANVHAPVEHRHEPTDRAGLAFIGSFLHTPNTDGLLWYFRKVHPLVLASAPETVLHVYGKNPPEELVAEATEGVVFEGFAPALSDVYDHARVAIAPLRYGAGVKGKVGEALSWGVPMVTTSIGAEGMALTHEQNIWIGDEPREFADGVLRLLHDDELWSSMARAGEAHIDALMGPGVLRRTLQGLLPAVS